MYKMLLFILFLNMLGAPYLSAQAHWEQEANLHHGLNGTVKSIKQFKYEAFEKFGKIEMGQKVKEPVHFLKTFNEQGYITEEVRYASKGFKMDSRTRWNYDTEGHNVAIIEYDSKDEMIRRVKKVFKNNNLKERIILDEDNTPITTLIFEYDSQNRWTESSDYEASGVLLTKVLNEYDELGNLIEYGYYDAKGNLIEKKASKFADDGRELEYRTYNKEGLLLKRISKYDDQNRLIQLDRFSGSEVNWQNRVIFTYDLEDKIIQLDSLSSSGGISKTLFQFDEMGNIISSSEMDTHGQLIAETTYEYDRKNNPTQILVHHPKDNMREKIVFEYDSRGNWIQRVDYKNEIPLTITKREVLYY